MNSVNSMASWMPDCNVVLSGLRNKCLDTALSTCKLFDPADSLK